MELTVTVVDPSGSRAAADVAISAEPGTAIGAVARELLGAVGRSEGELWCDAKALDAGTVLGEPPLLHGAVLTVDQPRSHEPRALLELHVVAGPDCGAVHPVPPGEVSIGRAAEARVRLGDPDVSRLHAVLRVAQDGSGGTTVHDLGSTNGTTVDGVPAGRAGLPVRPGQLLRVGDTRLVLALPETVPVSCRPDGAAHLLLNRPPRHRVPARPVRVTLPGERRPAQRQRFPLVALAVPLVLGVVLVTVTRSPTYLLFLLLSPLMLIGTYIGERIGGRRSRRAEDTEHAAAVVQCQVTVRQAVADESAGRRLAHPDLATLLLTATGPRPRLWERRRDDADFLDIRLGLGSVPSAVEVRVPGGADRPEALDRPDLTDVPVTVSLAAAGVVGLAGPRPQTLALARSVVAQLAGWHSPVHLGLVVLCPDPARTGEDWAWVRWLPHVAPVAGELPDALVAVTPDQVRARVDELLALLDARAADSARSVISSWSGRSVVVVLDGAGQLRREPGVVRLLAEGPPVGIQLLCLDLDLVSLPAECRATVEVRGSRLHVRSQDTATYGDVVPDGVGDLWAHRFSRALAPLRDATPDDRAAGLPARARLVDLLDTDVADPAAIEATWRVRPQSTRVPLGVGADGAPYVVDLAVDGPHVLVAGTTGSGKSELLQTLVAGLAATNRPDRLSFVLVDYKGGAAFADCARLPHTVGMVTDLDGHLTERAMQSLGAELRRREEVLRAAGCPDLDAYEAGPVCGPRGSPALARLVIVVDEFATLVEELPDFVGGLVGIAQRGRSLGVHLVLATQRPGGVVSADIRANTGLRIALRVTDPAESRDVVDVRDAADISRTTPGRAVARTGTGGVAHLQTARVTGSAEQHLGRSTVRPVPWLTLGAPRPATSAGAAAGPSDLARLVAATTEAARRLGADPPASPWLPPLPWQVTTTDVERVADGLGDGIPGGVVPIGLRDLPSEQRRVPVWLRLDHGDHLLVAGGPRSGRTTTLRTAAAELARLYDVGDLHLYAIDAGGGALAALARLPHCGAVVARDETVRGDRLLTRLVEEVERRQRLIARHGLGSLEDQRRAASADDRLPWLVLLLDGWEGLHAAYQDVEHGRPLDDVARLVREGAAVGLRVVLTGDRSVLTSRVGASFRERLVLPMADPVDYALAGIPARRVPADLPPGRALLADGSEVQVALLPGRPDTAGQVAAVEQVAARARARYRASARSGRADPMRVEALPGCVEADDVLAEARALAPEAGWTLLGVGGDELRPVGIDLLAEGPAFVVAGPPGSGRSTTLATMTRWLVARGQPTVLVTSRRSPLRRLEGVPGVLACLGPSDAGPLQNLLRTRPDLTVLADDAETLHDSPVERPLLGMLHPDAEGSAPLVLAGSVTGMAGCFRGVTVEARRTRTGLLLGQLAPGDGDLLGLRLTRRAAGPVGRGVLVRRGEVSAIQVARTEL